MMQRFKKRTAIVTGAASGIGLATARRLADEGARVLATDLSSLSFPPPDADPDRFAVLDVSDRQAVSEVIENAARRWGRIDVLVNAAGIMVADDVGTIDDDAWGRLLQVNLTGTMYVCRAVLEHMQRSRAGAIVNVASVAAFNASSGMASYAAGKAGVVAMTRAIANRYGGEGIRANCVAPGWVRTGMSEQEMEDLAKKAGTTAEVEFGKLTQRIALGRVADPAEIAACIAFLAADDASFVTGAVLVADGGARIATSSRAH